MVIDIEHLQHSDLRPRRGQISNNRGCNKTVCASIQAQWNPRLANVEMKYRPRRGRIKSMLTSWITQIASPTVIDIEHLWHLDLCPRRGQISNNRGCNQPVCASIQAQWNPRFADVVMKCRPRRGRIKSLLTPWITQIASPTVFDIEHLWHLDLCPRRGQISNNRVCNKPVCESIQVQWNPRLANVVMKCRPRRGRIKSLLNVGFAKNCNNGYWYWAPSALWLASPKGANFK
jgi:hypothetical protein